MRLPRPWLVLPALLSLGVGFGGGWTLRSWRETDEAPKSGRASSPVPSAARKNSPATAVQSQLSPGVSPTPEHVEDLRARLREAYALPGSWDKEVALHEVLDGLGFEELKALASAPDGFRREDEFDFLNRLGRLLAKHDPRTALAFARTLPQMRNIGNTYWPWSGSLQSAILAQWASTDLSAVQGFVNSLPAGDARSRLAHSFAFILEKTDRPAALRLLDSTAGADGMLRHERQNHYMALYHNWAAIDPQAAQEEALRLSDPYLKDAVLCEVATAGASQNPAAAFECAARIRNAQLQETAVRAVVAQWMKQDPAAAQAAALAQPPGAMRSALLLSVASVWATTDPAAALAWAQELPVPALRGSTLEAALTTWGKADPAAALAWSAENLPRSEVAARILRELVAKNPAQAQAAILALPAGAVRQAAIVGAAPRLAQADLAGTLALLSELPAGAKRSAAVLSLYDIKYGPNSTSKGEMGLDTAHLSITDPKLADQVLALLTPQDRNRLTSEIARRMGEADTAAALSWAEGLPPGSGRISALRAVGNVLEKTDPKGFIEWSLQRNTPGENSDILPSTFAQWAGKSQDEALAWLATQPQGKLRDEMTVTALNSMTYKDLPAALALFERETSSHVRQNTVNNLVSAWTNKEPDTAKVATWVLSLDEKDGRSSGISQLASNWSRGEGGKDPQAVTAWVESLEKPKDRSLAMSVVISQWTRTNPAQAAQWLDRLPAGPELDGHASRLWRTWNGNDPKAAQAWLSAQPNVSAKTRQSLLPK